MRKSPPRGLGKGMGRDTMTKASSPLLFYSRSGLHALEDISYIYADSTRLVVTCLSCEGKGSSEVLYSGQDPIDPLEQGCGVEECDDCGGSGELDLSFKDIEPYSHSNKDTYRYILEWWSLREQKGKEK